MSTWSPHAWQVERWQAVLDAIAQDRLGHALLLAGPRGAGKSHFAQGLAGYLLCESAGPGKPCGQCRGCIQVAAGVHPNLMKLAPAEDKRDIAIDDIRHLLERLQLSS
ncbi:MAG TPA: DNA polymerase III subunit delta', partial [Verrucomicrobiae bacterium]|nr:DNA polymerase III subunit delta' [Verrucomicrobiae bacterium]